MCSFSLMKLASLSSLFKSVYAQRESGDPSPLIELTRPDGTSIETQDWISPEYKWFYEYPLPIPPTKRKKSTWTGGSDGAEIDYYEVEIKSFSKQVYPNLPATPMVGYDGMLPGPTFVMQKGREAVVRFLNNGETNVSAHVHGQYNRSPFDGWAADTAAPGQYKDYYYPNAQNARTMWYHDHAEFATGENVYYGQEGFYFISDPEEQALGLPSGEYDIPMLIGASVFGSNGKIVFDTNDHLGLWGDVIQVNGQPWPYLNVEPRKYRLRLLDGSVSRTFDLSFNTDDGELLNFQVIASDCGLFGSPVDTNTIAISMGERYEVIIDFANYTNQNITLLNGRGVGDNVDYPATDNVMRFVVGGRVSDDRNNGDIPQTLRKDEPVAASSPKSKDFHFTRADDGTWAVNGVGFQDIGNRILTRPKRGTDEIWALHNGEGGGTHPVHLHLVDFKVLSRSGGRDQVNDYESAGWKDVVWLAAGETVEVVARYAPWNGVYMFHCHNLVHEDHDMLVAFDISNLDKWGYTNDTQFIDPMQSEFRPKTFDAADFTEDAINKKIAWLYSTNPYNRGNIDGVFDALDAYFRGEYWTQAPSSE